jgi:hypothetical protein
MDKEKDYFQEDGDLQEILGRFENMLNQLEALIITWIQTISQKP